MITNNINHNNPMTLYIGYLPKMGRNEEIMELTLTDIFTKIFSPPITLAKSDNSELFQLYNYLDKEGPFVNNNKIIMIKSIDLIEKTDRYSGKHFWMAFVHFNLSLNELIEYLQSFVQKISSIVKNSINHEYYRIHINHYQDTLKLFNDLYHNKESTIYYSQIPSGKGYLEHVGNVHYNSWHNIKKNNRKFIKIRAHQSLDQIQSYSNINNVHILSEEETEMLDDMIFDTIKDDLESEYMDMEIEDDWIYTALDNQYSDMTKDLEACERARSIFYQWTGNIKKSTLENDKNIPWNTRESFYANSDKGYYNLDDMMFIMSNLYYKWKYEGPQNHVTLLINPKSQLSIVPGMSLLYLNSLKVT